MEIFTRHLSITKRAFTRNLVRLNSLDFARWRLLPGMPFKAKEKWWAGGNRGRGHNGLDLRFYETAGGEVKTLSGETKIPLIHTARIIKIIPDFIGHSIFAEHASPAGGKRLFTIYGHVAPEEGIEDRQLEGGCVIGRLAPSKGSVPTHLHISIALVPADKKIPLEALNWETLDETEGVLFFDPEEIL